MLIFKKNNLTDSPLKWRLMTSHPLSKIQLQRLLRGCIYAVLFCAFFGAADDTRAQSKGDVCAALDMSTADCNRITGVGTALPANTFRSNSR